MKKTSILLALLLCLMLVSVVSAQGQGLELSLSRDWGYGGFNGDIQGTFSMHVKGPDDLVKVQFYIDDLMIGEDTSAPFAYQFLTDNYPTGSHVMKAVGFTSSGAQVESQPISALFISKEASSSSTIKMVGTILGALLLAVLISALIPMLNRRKGVTTPSGATRNYSFGGGICPKCKRPFGFTLLSLNMLTGKLTPCPHCGKWSVIRRASLAELKAAEQAEIPAQSGVEFEPSEEEKLKKDLDASRYQDL
jgi:hypothetical protein